MDIKEKPRLTTVYIRFTQIIFGIATLLMLVYLVIGEIVYPDERDRMQMNYREFETQWQQVLENGERVPVQLPVKIPADYGEVVTLVTVLPEELYEEDEILCFYTIWQDVAVYVDGELRQSYSTEHTRPFGTNSATRYIFVTLHREDAGKELIYQFSSNCKYAGMMNQCYIGDRMSAWLYVLEQSGAETIIGLFLLLMSLFCIIACVILRCAYKKTLPLYYLAWTIFLCALWILSEIGFRQLLIKNVSVLSGSTYWSLMLLPLPLTMYINEIQNGYYKKLYAVSMIYSTLVLLIGTFLQIFDKLQFVEQLPFIHFGIVVSIVLIITTITIDAFKKRISDYLPVGIGVYGMLLTAVWELARYYSGASHSLGTVLVVGLVFLLIMAIIKTGQDLFQSEQKKQQAILAREAQAKFLANMSHEIRTPINAVIGMNEMILRENENSAVEEYAHNIQSASNMLLGLVNDILDFSKIESNQMELVEDDYRLVSVLQDEILLLKTRAAGKPISVQLDIEPEIPSGLFGDELRIKQVLTNLLSNAVKYTKEGSVTLKVFFWWMEHDQIVLGFTVSDTGIGIREEDLSKLFDSFKRLELNKNRHIEGTGLGLNIAKRLVELMNGTITVESEYGKGSAFTVRIPQKVVDRQPVGALEEILHDRRNKQKDNEKLFTAPEARVLAVDDNTINLAVIKGLLKRTKVRLDLAKSGRECLALTRSQSYDVILMDHMMPELDGVDTLHMLREDVQNPNRNTIVIALTANAVAGCREQYLEYGFNEYISKPIQVEMLDKMLLRFLPENLVHMEEAPKEQKKTKEADWQEEGAAQTEEATDCRGRAQYSRKKPADC